MCKQVWRSEAEGESINDSVLCDEGVYEGSNKAVLDEHDKLDSYAIARFTGYIGFPQVTLHHRIPSFMYSVKQTHALARPRDLFVNVCWGSPKQICAGLLL